MDTILLHGLGQNASAWGSVMAALPDKGAITPELSDCIGGGSWQELYSGAAARLDAAEAPLCLCGLSLGAVLALNYAAENPGRVGSMLLIAPQFRMPKALLRFQALLFCVMPERSFAESGLSRKQFIALTLDMAKLDFTPVLERVTCPVITACGERDRANSGAARRLAQLLPHGEYAEIPDSGHEANTNAPEFTAQLITKAQARR